jgi:hypothetical protein
MLAAPVTITTFFAKVLALLTRPPPQMPMVNVLLTVEHARIGG